MSDSDAAPPEARELNRSIWDKVRRPPPTALKQIKGGRLSGMTDISPQWRYEIMTEVFGPAGDQWGFDVKDRWTFEASDGEVGAFTQVLVWYFMHGEVRCEVTGLGGSRLIAKESGGLRFNDEAWKMSLTDAIGTALKVIGVGADIYAGRWDGSKYTDDGGATPAGAPQPSPRNAVHGALSKQKAEEVKASLERLFDDEPEEERKLLFATVLSSSFGVDSIEALGRLEIAKIKEGWPRFVAAGSDYRKLRSSEGEK